MSDSHELERTASEALDRIIPKIQVEIQDLSPEERAKMLAAIIGFCGVGLSNSRLEQLSVSPDTIDRIMRSMTRVDQLEIDERII